MSVSAARVMQALLVELGLSGGTTSSATWPTQAGIEPSSPANTITVFEIGAMSEGIIQKTGERILKPRCQIRIRSNATNGYQIAEDKGFAIQNALAAIKPEAPVQVTTTNGKTVNVYSVVIDRDLLWAGQSEANNSVFTIEARLNFREVV